MIDYVCLGPTPAAEDCVQVGDPDYRRKAMDESRRFVALVRQVLGKEPLGAALRVRFFPHDFGEYAEVVCEYDDACQEAEEYAFRCESEAPEEWPKEASSGTGETPTGAPR